MSSLRASKPKSTRALQRAPSLRGIWPWVLLSAGILGGLAALFSEFAIGVALVVGVALLFARSGVKTEIIVGLYWLAFCVYQTILYPLSITGFFYPFYAAFLIALVVAMLRGGIRTRPVYFWLMAAFLAVVAVSFVGFVESIDFWVIQRVLAYLLAPLIYLQFRSRQGVFVVAGAAVVSALALGAWVVFSAIQGGFSYRGDVDVNQNDVAFYVGMGFITAACFSIYFLGTERRRALGALMLILTGFIFYSLLLLASRGMAIAGGVAFAAVVARTVVLDRRKVLTLLALFAIGAAGLLLPGGEGLLQRFQGERIESGGSRIPIWTSVLDAYGAGSPMQLLAGFGFDSSKQVVKRGSGTLTSTHNAYLEILYEFGLLGLTLFLALHVAAIVTSWHIAGALGLIMFGLSWYLLGVNMTSTAADGFLYWTALAFILSIGTWGERRLALSG